MERYRFIPSRHSTLVGDYVGMPSAPGLGAVDWSKVGPIIESAIEAGGQVATSAITAAQQKKAAAVAYAPAAAPVYVPATPAPSTGLPPAAWVAIGLGTLAAFLYFSPKRSSVSA